MVQMAPSPEPSETPPPIPSRSHLRNDSAHQLKPFATKSNAINMAGTPPFAASQALPKDSSRMSANMQQSLHSPVLQEMDGKEDPKPEKYRKNYSARFQNKHLHIGGGGYAPSELCASEAGIDMGLSDDLQKPLHLAPLIPHLVIPYERDQKASKDHSKVDGEAIDISKHSTTQSGKCHTTAWTATKTGLGLTSHSLQASQYNCQTSDTKVSDWLTHGLLDAPVSDAGSLTRNSRSSDRSLASKHVPLSLFPPKSSPTDVREYTPRNAPSIHSVIPLSPLNNGRDAYGNHIPSSVHDYSAAHSQSQLLRPWPSKDEKTPLGEKPSTASRLYDRRWNRLKAFWKAANTQVSSQQINPQSPHTICGHDTMPWDTPEVTYSGRVINREPQSIPSLFPAMDSGKGNYSAPHLKRHRMQDTNSKLDGPDLVDAGETPRLKYRFNTTCNHRGTSRDERAWHIESLPFSKSSLQLERSSNHTSVYSKNGRTANMKDESPNRCRKVEHERKMRSIQGKKPLHGEQLICKQEAHKQDQSDVCEDAKTTAIPSSQAKGLNKLQLMPDFGIRIPRKSISSSRDFPGHDPSPVPAQDPKNQKQNIVTPEHAVTIPVSASVMVSAVEKPQTPLRTMLSKARNISRSIFTSSFNPQSKASAQRRSSTNSSKTTPPKVSMSTDRNGCPHYSPANAREANSPVGHYQVLTAGAFDDPVPSLNYNHDNRESLASATNEALLIADQLLQHDVRWSTDQVRSSFSSDSTSETEPQQDMKKDKKVNKRKGEGARTAK